MASLRWQRILMERAIPAALLVLPLSYAWLTQPFRIPDEFNHFFRVYQVSEGRMVGQLMAEGFCGDLLPASLQEVGTAVGDFPAIPKRRLTAEDWRKGAAIQLDAQRRIPTHFPNSVIYAPLVYAPAAVAVAAGRALGQPPLYLLYFGRIANALVAGVLVILALRLIPFQRDCLWVAAFLPMTLSQMGSVAADAMIFAIIFVWLALALAFTRNRAKPVGWREGAALIAAAVALGQLRPPYSLLVLLVLEPRVWRRDFDPRRRVLCLAAVGLAGLLGAAWFLASRHLIVPVDPQALTNPGAQLDFVWQHPIGFLATGARTLAANFGNYWQATLGVLGWLDTPLPAWIYLGLSIALVASTMLGENRAEPSRALRCYLAALVILNTLLIFLALYQLWSPVGADSISGIQGRYFIPLLPLLGMVFASRWLSARPRADWIRWVLFAFVIVANLVALVTVATTGAAA